MKIAYFDCFSGASGDMILGALTDAGLDPELLRQEIAKLHLTHYDLTVKKVMRNGIGGTQAIVSVDDEYHRHHHRHLSHILEIIDKSDLNATVKQKSREIFTRLAEAEAKVHRTDIENIHFHEVGAMDAIIDVAGSVAGMSLLGIEKIYCSPLHVGTGTVKCAHGILPVPAPATMELIKGKPAYSTEIKGELLTPTGAAILTTLSSGFGPMPPMTAEKIGYGAGNAEREIPNLLRVVIGDALEKTGEHETDQTAVIETGIDDMNPQIYEYVMQQLPEIGALDVFLTRIQMKKNRPATLLTVICPPENVEKISHFLMRETTTIGLRWRIDRRIKARRTLKQIQTEYGPVNVKTAEIGDEIVNVMPEYEDCKRIALEKKIPLKQVMEAAMSQVASGVLK
ncbi:MAG: TIGR00299 family protein [Desulfobacteraceae bacterium IS3]|nr:MAG: TIGR00299 family protein [Desulfobacteraceae bacterium IS3]